MTVDAIEVLHALNDQAALLDGSAAELEQVEDELKAVELEYEEFMAAFEAGLWERHVQDSEKWPPERVRERLGRRAMSPDLLGRYVALIAQRRQVKDRIGSLKASVEARRSILSALKEGLVS